VIASTDETEAVCRSSRSRAAKARCTHSTSIGRPPGALPGDLN
jgi:hypothetical protein